MLDRDSHKDYTAPIRTRIDEIGKSRQIGVPFAPDQNVDGRSKAACMSRGPSGPRNLRGRNVLLRQIVAELPCWETGFSPGVSVRLATAPVTTLSAPTVSANCIRGITWKKNAVSPFRHSPLKPEPAGTASTPALDSSAQDRLNQMRPRLAHHLRE